VLRVSFFFLHAVVLFPRLSSVRKEKTLEKITSTRRKKKRTRTAFSFPSEGSSCWFVSVPVRNHRKRFQKILFFHNPKKKNLQKLFIVSKNWLGFCSAFPFFWTSRVKTKRIQYDLRLHVPETFFGFFQSSLQRCELNWLQFVLS